MTYNRPLPSIRSLGQLASSNGPFPVKCHHIVACASRHGFGSDMQAFLKLFPLDTVFRSRDDFLERCQSMEILIRSERDMPVERLRSPQD